MRPDPRPPAETAGAPRRRARRNPLRVVAWCAALSSIVASTGELRSLDLPPLARLLIAGADQARIATRAGDAVPGEARFSGRFACGITALPDGGMLFVDSGGDALFRKTGDAIALLAYAGLEAPGGGRFESFCESAVGGDGTIAFHAALADGREAIYRIAPGSSGPQAVLREGDPVMLASGPAAVVSLLGPAVDGSGAVVIAADLGDGTSVVLTESLEGATRIVIQTGDRLGSGVFLRAPVAPAVNGGGTVALAATIDSGLDLVAEQAPGGPPLVLFEARPSPPFPAPFLELAPPAIDDQGRVAFLLADRGTVKLERASPGLAVVLAAPGFTAPGGGAFDEITDLPPAIGASGSVLFGAVRSDGRSGIYVAPPPLGVIAESDVVLPDGERLGSVGNRQPAPTPAFAAGGAVWFAAEAAGRPGLFSTGTGGIGAEVRAGDPIPGPARHVGFFEDSIPYLGGGPALADDGSILFDARLVGGSRGLFARDRSGGLAAAALDGDPAPGSGSRGFDGERFAFHSTNGVVAAFLGAERPEPGATAGAAARPALYYGPLGGGA